MQGLRIFSALGGAPSADEIDAAHRVAATHKEMGHGVIRQTDAKTGVTVEYYAFKRVAMTSRVGGLWFSGATGLTNPNGATFFVDWTNPSNHSAGKSLYISSSTGFSTSVTMTPNAVSWAPPQSWSGDGFYYTIDGGVSVYEGGVLTKRTFSIAPLSRFSLDGVPLSSLPETYETESPVLYAPTVIFQSGSSARCDPGSGFYGPYILDVDDDIELFFAEFGAGVVGLNFFGAVPSLPPGAPYLADGFPAYYYANSTQRLSASITFDEASTYGFYAYQASDDTVWGLIGTAPSMAWSLIETGYNARTGVFSRGFSRIESNRQTSETEIFHGYLDRFHSSLAANGRILGPIVATDFPTSSSWHAGYLINGTWNSSSTSFSVSDTTGSMIYRGVSFSPISHTSVYTSYIAARQAAADRHAAWAVEQATSLVPQTPSVAAPFQLQSIIDSTYGSALGGFRPGAPLTVVPVTKKVTSKFTGTVLGYMPAGMPALFPATVEAESKALGYATMVYNTDLAEFVTEAWTLFESGDPPVPSPRTIGPTVVDVAFEATDLKLIGTTGDLSAQAKAQADLMQYTGVPEGFPYLGELNETYRGAKEAVTGVPRPMKPWPPA